MHLYAFLTLALGGLVLAQNPSQIYVPHTATDTCAILDAQTTAVTEHPTSNVPGKVFDRIMIVYLETTDFANSTVDPNCIALIKKGILLTSNYGVGAPSQPNYIAPASGDTFGLNSDSFILVDRNISTIVDLLEDKGISWSNYNEGLPYTGFEGFQWDNGLYMRKHNLLARFDSVRLDPSRIAKVKNTTIFYEELQNKKLPQWMFVTPNLFDDGHNTDIRTSCAWTRGFVEDLLKNKYFNKKTLVYVTWQANGDKATTPNHVAGILLGSAVPKHLVGTTDNNYYNHYSDLASVQANWGLHTLGRWDVGANVWDFVGKKTGDKPRKWNVKVAGGPLSSYFWNQSYGGVFSSANRTTHTYVAPNLNISRNGRTILPAIAQAWAGSTLPSYYEDIIELPDDFHPPKGFPVPVPLDPPPPISTAILVYPYANPPPVSPTPVCAPVTPTAKVNQP